jgi:hypothetical protein
VWVFGPWWLILLGWALTASRYQWDKPPGQLPALTGNEGVFQGYRWRIRFMPELGAVNADRMPVPWVAQLYIQYAETECGGETAAYVTADGARAFIQRAVLLSNAQGNVGAPGFPKPCYDADVRWPDKDDL